MVNGAEGTEAREETGGRPRRVVWVLLVVLAAVVAVVVWSLLGDDGGGSTDAAAGGGTGDTPAAVAQTDAIELTGVQLTSVEDGIDPATGLPTAERERYDTGEGARLWVQFTYTGDQPGQDALYVRWYRDGEEIFQSSWRLPQPVENHNVALGASYTEEAGNYRVEVVLNDEVLHTTNFEVG